MLFVIKLLIKKEDSGVIVYVNNLEDFASFISMNSFKARIFYGLTVIGLKSL